MNATFVDGLLSIFFTGAIYDIKIRARSHQREANKNENKKKGHVPMKR